MAMILKNMVLITQDMVLILEVTEAEVVETLEAEV
ncbi:hypothetical protein A2U01_0096469, partial [Trifolium medium]|nr:hypothetical protein [Trifolium medium]